jgi:hypothetical protein
MADLCLDFQEVSTFFSRVVAPACIPTSSGLGLLFFPHPHQHFLLMVFWVMTILTGVRWNLNVVLICISFMARDDEHIFMCFFGHLNFFF